MTGSDRWGSGEWREETVMRYGVAVAGVLALAAIPMVTAAWPGIGSSVGQTAPFTGRSASSQIDVGDAGTVPLFDLSNVEAGNSVAACFRARIDAGSHESSFVRLYSSGLPEIEHARRVGIHILTGTPIAGSDAVPGIVDCDEIEGPLTRLTLREGSIVDYASTRFAYTIGDPLGWVGPGISTVVVRRLDRDERHRRKQPVVSTESTTPPNEKPWIEPEGGDEHRGLVERVGGG